jgi:hypothetical protein
VIERGLKAGSLQALQKFAGGIGQQDKYFQNWQHVRFLKDSIRAKLLGRISGYFSSFEGGRLLNSCEKKEHLYGTAVQLSLFCSS